MSGNIITARELEKRLTPGIKVKSLEAMGHEMTDSVANKLFTDQNSDRWYEEPLTTNTIGQYEEFQGSITFGSVKEGYSAKYYNKEYVNGFQIEQKFIRTNLYKQMWPKSAYELGLSYAQSVEDISMGVFRHANDTTVITLPDTLALASTAHTSSVDTSYTQSNKTTSALSAAQLEAITIAGARWKTDNQTAMRTRFKVILVPPDLSPIAERINNSQLGGTSLGGDNAVNIQYRRWTIEVSEYLTDTTDYFVIDPMRMKNNLFRNWVAKNEIGSAEDFSSMAAKFRGYCFFGLEVDDWRWVYCGIA